MIFDVKIWDGFFLLLSIHWAVRLHLTSKYLVKTSCMQLV